MSSQFYFAPYSVTVAYSQNDVVYGINIGSTTYGSPYFYATQNITAGGYSPSGVYIFTVGSYSRSDDIITLNYTHTGGPSFAAGSIVKITTVTDVGVNYTGMVINGGSGSFQYVSPGFPTANTVVGAGTITCFSPAWTTGFMWKPTYTTKIGTKNNTITAQFGDGYSQRQAQGINTFEQTINLTYQNIGKRQARAMQNYIEDKAGSESFQILLGDQFLNNQPNQKWAAASIDVSPTSFGLYDAQVPVTRVFDP